MCAQEAEHMMNTKNALRTSTAIFKNSVIDPLIQFCGRGMWNILSYRSNEFNLCVRAIIARSIVFRIDMNVVMN